MSTEAIDEATLSLGVPELTSLGKRLEILRIERGISKQRLARHAGTSRQQLWRVMTGKCELTSSLRDRLAVALSIDPTHLASLGGGPATHTYSLAAASADAPIRTLPSAAPTLSDFLSDASHLAATFRTLPTGDPGRRLKRALLNAVEDLAVETGQPLTLAYSELRRSVLHGEL
jgi:transcriptional regulator with XRE-family HTH domain